MRFASVKITKYGFSLIEIMVAVVVLSIGLLGMAAMTVMVMRGNRMAVRQTNATNLAQQQLERLKDVSFEILGTQGGCATPNTLGVLNTVCVEANLDALGAVAPVDGSGRPIGPTYHLFINICDSTSAAQTVDGAATSFCDITNARNSGDLTCDGNLNAGEKQILLQVSWLDQGECHRVNLETVVVDTI